MASEKDGAAVSERAIPIIQGIGTQDDDDISPTSTPVPKPAFLSPEPPVVGLNNDLESGLGGRSARRKSPRRSRSRSQQRQQDAQAQAQAEAEAEEVRRRADVERREAAQYWGYMVKPDNGGSDKLNSLLGGIAQYISTNFEGLRDCPDLTPAQLAHFYRSVGGNYDVLFIDTLPASLSTIYTTLGCLHSLQPTSLSDRLSPPSIPALKHRGFITWQTIQLLLGPEEHVPFLQQAVEKFDIKDPKTGAVFPKILPAEVFPKEADPRMSEWYDQVHEKLQRDMQAPPQRSLSLSDASTASELELSGDEKLAAAAAAGYFRDPMFRAGGALRPGMPAMGRVSSYGGKSLHMRGSRQPSFTDRGKAVVDSVRHFISPPTPSHQRVHSEGGGKRGSYNTGHPRERFRDHDIGEELDDDYEELTPTGIPPHYRTPKPPRSSHQRGKSPNPASTTPLAELMTDSDSDSVRVSKRPSAGIRRTSSREKREREARERDATARRLEREIKELTRERERDMRHRHRDKENYRERDSVSPGRPVSGSKHDSKSPPLRHRRSYEPQVSPVDYFPRPFFEDEPRRNSHSHSHGRTGSYAGSDVSATGGFAPSKEPSMASRVANMQHRTSSPRRVDEARLGGVSGSVSGGAGVGSYPPRSVPPIIPAESGAGVGSYNGRPTVRYSRQSIDEDRKRDRERDRDRDWDRDRERDRDIRGGSDRYGSGSGSSRSRGSRGRGGDGGGGDDYLREPPSSSTNIVDDIPDGAGKARSRSYERDPERNSANAERLRQSTRYVEGAGGRRYPSKVPWQ